MTVREEEKGVLFVRQELFSNFSLSSLHVQVTTRKRTVSEKGVKTTMKSVRVKANEWRVKAMTASKSNEFKREEQVFLMF